MYFRRTREKDFYVTVLIDLSGCMHVEYLCYRSHDWCWDLLRIWFFSDRCLEIFVYNLGEFLFLRNLVRGDLLESLFQLDLPSQSLRLPLRKQYSGPLWPLQCFIEMVVNACSVFKDFYDVLQSTV